MDTNSADQPTGIKGFVLKVWRAGMARRVTVTREERTLLDLPLTVVVIGAVVAPVALAVGAVVAVLTGCQLAVRQPAPEDEAEDEPVEDLLPTIDDHPLG